MVSFKHCAENGRGSTSPVILQELPALLYLTSHSARTPSPTLPHQSFCKSSQSHSTSPVILQELPVSLYLTSYSTRAPSLALPHQSFCKSYSCGCLHVQEYRREMVCTILEVHVRCCTSGKLDGCCTDLPMKEHNRALMNGDPGCQHYNMWERRPRSKKKKSKICKNSDCRSCII